jgi:hypothetical protein
VEILFFLHIYMYMFDNVDRLKFQRRWSALHFAVFGNHADVIQLLFELGANVCFDVIYVCRCLIYRVIRSMFSVHATGLRCIRLHFSVMPRAFRHCSLPVPIRSVSTLADICHTSLQSSKRYMIMSAGICPKSHTLKLQHTACYKLLKNATKATPVREKSPRKLLGSVTVAHGLGAAPSASESTRLAVPDAANSARAKPRVAQSSPNLMRHAERTWTCPSCEYAHNAAAICAVCATNRPGTSAASSPQPSSVVRVPSPRAPLPVPAASSPPAAAAPPPARNRSPRPRRLDSAIQEVLARLELASYADTFVENEIDHAALLLLTENDLKDLGITALGPRRKLLAYIQDPKFQPYKPGYGTSDSLQAPPTLPGTMVAPIVPRNELFRSSGGSMYERAPPPTGEYAHVTVAPSGAAAVAASSPYAELPPLNRRPSGYNPIPISQSQVEVPENESDDSGDHSDGDGVYGVLPAMNRQK